MGKQVLQSDLTKILVGGDSRAVPSLCLATKLKLMLYMLKRKQNAPNWTCLSFAKSEFLVKSFTNLLFLVITLKFFKEGSHSSNIEDIPDSRTFV